MYQGLTILQRYAVPVKIQGRAYTVTTFYNNANKNIKYILIFTGAYSEWGKGGHGGEKAQEIEAFP